MSHDRLRLLLLTALMAAVAVTVTIITLANLYTATLSTHRQRLTDLVATRAALITTLLAATSGDLEVTRDLLTEVQAKVPALGETGEFTVGRRDGEQVSFLVPLRYPIPGGGGRSVAEDNLAEPMRRALTGLSGTMIGRDYRGHPVLAAYQPVEGADWGLVAKIDLTEVRAPIVRAAGISLAATALLVGLGALLFTRITSPVLHRIEGSERRYRQMFDTAPVSIWDEDWREVIAIVRRLSDEGVVDFRRYFDHHPEVVQEALQAVRIRAVNQATLTMFEASDKADLLGSLETVFATPDTLPGFVGELVALAEGREVYTTEMALRTVSGRLIHTLLTMSFPPPDSDSGEVLVSLMDITARKRAEQELARLNAELEDRIAARTGELEHSVTQLAAANTELESFSYTVSHDLRAPLRAIDGFSRILVDEHGAALEAEARRYLQIVRDNTQHMGQLIDDLLAFSRLSRQELRTQSVELGELVAAAWRELELDREGRRVELTVAELPTIQGDPRLLKLVFGNLLGNALKFTRPREVAQIEVGVSRIDDTDVCYVRDNGVGFDARYADKLFGVFQRLHRADQFEGTGVGLATVARVVHRHRGRVWAESVVDQGATFYLSFDRGDHAADQSG